MDVTSQPQAERGGDALAKFRGVHGKEKTMVDVEAGSGVAKWAEWGGEAGKMPTAAPQCLSDIFAAAGSSQMPPMPTAGARMVEGPEKARSPPRPPTQQTSQPTQVEQPRPSDEEKTLADVAAGGGVAPHHVPDAVAREDQDLVLRRVARVRKHVRVCRHLA